MLKQLMPGDNFFFFTGATTLCVGLGLYHSFVEVDFSGVGVFASHSAPITEDHGLNSSGPLPFDLSGVCGPTRSLRLHQHSSPGHCGRRPPLSDKAVVLEEEG
jgi:hypothetical protein